MILPTANSKVTLLNSRCGFGWVVSLCRCSCLQLLFGYRTVTIITRYLLLCRFIYFAVPMDILYSFSQWILFLSRQTQDWRRRYFILKGNRLFFAKSPLEPPHGMIDLSRCTTVKSADLKSHKKHSFEISTPETTYLLYAGWYYWCNACDIQFIFIDFSHHLFHFLVMPKTMKK